MRAEQNRADRLSRRASELEIDSNLGLYNVNANKLSLES